MGVVTAVKDRTAEEHNGAILVTTLSVAMTMENL